MKRINKLGFLWNIKDIIIITAFLIATLIIFNNYPHLEIFHLNIPNILFLFVPGALVKILGFYTLWSLKYIEKISIRTARVIYTIVDVFIFLICIILKFILGFGVSIYIIVGTFIVTAIGWSISMSKFDKNIYGKLYES